VDEPLNSVTHGQCVARPTVTFPVAERHCRTAGTRLKWIILLADRGRCVCVWTTCQRSLLSSGTVRSRTRNLLPLNY